jgi:hypothetical protein
LSGSKLDLASNTSEEVEETRRRDPPVMRAIGRDAEVDIITVDAEERDAEVAVARTA